MVIKIVDPAATIVRGLSSTQRRTVRDNINDIAQNPGQGQAPDFS
jgi:hypothetical protein